MIDSDLSGVHAVVFAGEDVSVIEKTDPSLAGCYAIPCRMLRDPLQDATRSLHSG